MKTLSIIIFLIICTLVLHSEEHKYNFSLPCDSLSTQAAMNNCSYEKYKLIDSVVSSKFDCIVSYLESQKNKSIAKKDKYMIDYFDKVINSLIISHHKWKELSNANMEIAHNYYKGGSIRPLMVNVSAIKDALNRLSKLDSIIVMLVGDENQDFCK